MPKLILDAMTPASFIEKIRNVKANRGYPCLATLAKELNVCNRVISEMCGLTNMLIGCEPNDFDQDEICFLLKNLELEDLEGIIGTATYFTSFEDLKNSNPKLRFINMPLLVIHEVFNSENRSQNSASFALGTVPASVKYAFKKYLKQVFKSANLPIDLASFIEIPKHIMEKLSFRDLSLVEIHTSDLAETYGEELLREMVDNSNVQPTTTTANALITDASAVTNVSSTQTCVWVNSSPHIFLQKLEQVTLRELHKAILNINSCQETSVINIAAYQPYQPGFFQEPMALLVNAEILNNYLKGYGINYNALKSLDSDIAIIQFDELYDQPLSQTALHIKSLFPNMTCGFKQADMPGNQGPAFHW